MSKMATEKRLIDANKIKYHTVGAGGWGIPEEVACKSQIDRMPTVDAVEVVHGEWVFGELDMLGASVKCSNCGWGVDNADPILWMDYPAHKFCGNCGAKMDEKIKPEVLSENSN